ncbi:MFS transporter [candidate division KSB1 bacterium]|nr:MFS transporter [candidate division KSB1 bacterium]
MRPIEKRVIAITCLGHALSHVYILVFATALMVLQKEFHISLTQITRIGTLSYLVYGLGAFPAGILAARTNAKFTMQLFFLLSSIAAILIGLTHSLSVFTASIILLGLVGSLYHVSGLTIITQVIEKRGKALGIHGVAGSAGIALTPILTGLIISGFGWREVYLLLAIPGLTGFFFLLFDRTIPHAHVQMRKSSQSENRKGLPFKVILIAALVMSVNGLIYRGFMTMLPTYIGENVTLGGFSAVLTGGLFATIILSIGMIGQFVGGHLSDRFPMIRLYLITIAITLPFMLLISATHNILLILVALLFALFHFPQQPIENHLIAHIIPHRFVSWAYGIKFTLTFGVGSFAAGLAGIIADKWSLSTVFLFLGGLIVISALLLAILVPREKEILD